MKTTNILRSIVLAIGAAYLIFSQDHSASVGLITLQLVSAVLAVGSFSIFLFRRKAVSRTDVLISLVLAAAVSSGTFFIDKESTNELVVFKALVVLFAMTIAVSEVLQIKKAKAGEVIELQISSVLGFATAVLFAFAPLNDLNAVGFLSAYLAISAIQRAVWAAGPTGRKK